MTSDGAVRFKENEFQTLHNCSVKRQDSEEKLSQPHTAAAAILTLLLVLLQTAVAWTADGELPARGPGFPLTSRVRERRMEGGREPRLR